MKVKLVGQVKSEEVKKENREPYECPTCGCKGDYMNGVRDGKDEARREERETLFLKLESLLIHVKNICAKKNTGSLSVKLSMLHNLRKLIKELNK